VLCGHSDKEERSSPSGMTSLFTDILVQECSLDAIERYSQRAACSGIAVPECRAILVLK
jgi:hypothetical protein